MHTCIAALQQVTAVADHVNNFIRQQENFRKMVSIQNSFTGNYVPGIVAPGRQFIREGLLMKVDSFTVTRHCDDTVSWQCRCVRESQRREWYSCFQTCCCMLKLTTRQSCLELWPLIPLSFSNSMPSTAATDVGDWFHCSYQRWESRRMTAEHLMPLCCLRWGRASDRRGLLHIDYRWQAKTNH